MGDASQRWKPCIKSAASTKANATPPPSPSGAPNVMMATGVLRGFGLDDAQVAKANEVFLDIPNGVSASVPLTLRQYSALEAAAVKEGKSVQELLKAALEKLLGEAPKK